MVVITTAKLFYFCLVLCGVWLFVTPWFVACQAPLSLRFPRQEYRSGLPFPSPGDLPDPGINLHLLHWPADSLALNHQGSIARKCYSISLVTQLCPTLCNPTDCSTPASLSITSSRSLLKLMSIQSVIPSNHLILYRPLHLLPSIFPRIMVFSNESVLCIRWPKYWVSALASVLPMNIQDSFILGLTGLISLLSMGLLRVFSSHSSKASVLQCPAFFMVQLSHLYMIIGKTTALTTRTFVGKVTSLLF